MRVPGHREQKSKYILLSTRLSAPWCALLATPLASVPRPGELQRAVLTRSAVWQGDGSG